MRTLRDHHREDLFDPWEYLGPQRRKPLEQIWAGVFRDHLLQHLPVKDLAAAFREDIGRPSKDLHAALGALILQQLHDLTDQQAVEAVAFNIAWHFALDIRHEPDACLCKRTLQHYRRRIIERRLEETLFRTLTDPPIKRVGVDTSKQRLDSTTVNSAIRGLTRLGILVGAACTRHDKDALEPAIDDVIQRGVKPDELLADSHYGSNECLEKGQQRGRSRLPVHTAQR